MSLRYGQNMTTAQAEKFFNKKASPDASLSPKQFMNKKITQLAMSKPVGKVLDSKVGKVGVKAGNTIMKGIKKITPDMKKVTDDMFGSPERGLKQKLDAEKLNRDYSGLPSKRRSTSDGSMR